jgi:hypothetical protein
MKRLILLIVALSIVGTVATGNATISRREGFLHRDNVGWSYYHLTGIACGSVRPISHGRWEVDTSEMRGGVNYWYLEQWGAEDDAKRDLIRWCDAVQRRY